MGYLAVLVGLGAAYASWDLVEAIRRQRAHRRSGLNGLGELVAKADVRAAQTLVAVFVLFLLALTARHLPLPAPWTTLIGQASFLLMTVALVLHVATIRFHALSIHREVSGER